ncbi:hypothetical protein M409DRAFT_59454 [Zasmidium cellare ATCC 36951]|uniref:Uncharacterized protein n=1 Tax=Zasmidium cellare ATCC 36951 TaxID=1080233 RepID=A0A6A6C1U6_ZASCE|nr:uncharacterized protein M409DRAFT_59454 [Zasmidium cellare ATCC 36951]KAF2160925.1 hypothetical protein M409DRAFT_59454 [Zasmidium cellare ATCC 36951]
MDCDDRQNHLPVPAGIVGLLPCTPVPANRGPCNRHHPGRIQYGFEVCERCRDHSKHMLLLEPTPTAVPAPLAPLLPAVPLAPVALAAPGAANRRRLGQGSGMFPPAIPRAQPGVGPPEALGPPYVAPWQTPVELASSTVLAPPRANPPFDGFLTRVCQHCEQAIQSEIMHLNMGNLPGTIAMGPAQNLWEQVPTVSCTCKATLGLTFPPQERLCLTHQEKVWNDLVKKRDSNDRWLRNIQRDGQLLVPATPATKQDRVQSGFWRACRCGQEIDHNPIVGNLPPQCYVCMACEGWVSRIGVVIPYPLLTVRQVSNNHRRFKTLFKMQRKLPHLAR